MLLSVICMGLMDTSDLWTDWSRPERVLAGESRAFGVAGAFLGDPRVLPFTLAMAEDFIGDTLVIKAAGILEGVEVWVVCEADRGGSGIVVGVPFEEGRCGEVAGLGIFEGLVGASASLCGLEDVGTSLVSFSSLYFLLGSDIIGLRVLSWQLDFYHSLLACSSPNCFLLCGGSSGRCFSGLGGASVSWARGWLVRACSLLRCAAGFPSCWRFLLDLCLLRIFDFLCPATSRWRL